MCRAYAAAKKKFERTVIAGLGDKLSMRLAGGSRNYERIVQKIVAAGSCKGNFGETGLVVGLFLGVWGFVAAIRSATCFHAGLVFSRAPLPPASSPLLAALSVSAYHRD